MQTLEIKRLKNPELHLRLKKLAAEERKLTHLSVLHIIEVMKRRLFLTMGFSSLFEYLTTDIGYCNASAQLRIDTARLMLDVPELGEKIEEGKMTLSKVSVMQKVFREVVKTQKIEITPEEKQSLVAQVENKSAKETDVFLSQTFDLSVIVKESVKVQKDESVRYQLTLTAEENAILEEARKLMGHTLEKSKISGDANYGIKKLLLHWAKKEIKSRTSVRLKKSTSPGEVKDEIPREEAANEVMDETMHEMMKEAKKNATDETTKETAQQGMKEIKSAHAPPQSIEKHVLTPSLKKQILLRDQCCQFKLQPDAKVCGSRHFLEVDHIHPKWAGGVDHPENLRAICRQHNQWRYEVGK